MEDLDDDDYTLAGAFVRGPHHYSKQYYLNFIHGSNRSVYEKRLMRRSQFVPSTDAKEKSFKERFHVYLDKLQKEDARRKRAVLKSVKILEGAVSQAVGNVTYTNMFKKPEELQSSLQRPLFNEKSFESLK